MPNDRKKSVDWDRVRHWDEQIIPLCSKYLNKMSRWVRELSMWVPVWHVTGMWGFPSPLPLQGHQAWLSPCASKMLTYYPLELPLFSQIQLSVHSAPLSSFNWAFLDFAREPSYLALDFPERPSLPQSCQMICLPSFDFCPTIASHLHHYHLCTHLHLSLDQGICLLTLPASSLSSHNLGPTLQVEWYLCK